MCAPGVRCQAAVRVAVGTIQRALRVQQLTLGEEHTDTLETANNLAVTLIGLGERHADAAAIAERTHAAHDAPHDVTHRVRVRLRRHSVARGRPGPVTI